MPRHHLSSAYRVDQLDREHERAVTRAVTTSVDRSVKVTAVAGGDVQRLRGIPVIGPGVGGASPGTKPAA